MAFSELEHSGVKGMKWGIRRYQNKDGTLTPAGRKRYNKEMAKLRAEAKTLKNKQATQKKMDRLEAKKKEIEELKKSTSQSEPKNKSVKEMGDDELRDYVTRHETRLDLERRYAALTPKETSKGKAFAKRAVSNMLLPAAEDVGKQLIKTALTKGANKTFGLEGEDRVYTNNKRK